VPHLGARLNERLSVLTNDHARDLLCPFCQQSRGAKHQRPPFWCRSATPGTEGVRGNFGGGDGFIADRERYVTDVVFSIGWIDIRCVATRWRC
jgi:hypothetical protein